MSLHQNRLKTGLIGVSLLRHWISQCQGVWIGNLPVLWVVSGLVILRAWLIPPSSSSLVLCFCHFVSEKMLIQLSLAAAQILRYWKNQHQLQASWNSFFNFLEFRFCGVNLVLLGEVLFSALLNISVYRMRDSDDLRFFTNTMSAIDSVMFNPLSCSSNEIEKLIL